VSVFNAVTFESIDVKKVHFLVWGCVFRIFRPDSNIKLLHRHGQEEALALAASPLKMLKAFLCISRYSKTFSRRIIYALFSQPVVGGASSLDLAEELSSQTRNLPTSGKILRAPVSRSNGVIWPYWRLFDRV